MTDEFIQEAQPGAHCPVCDCTMWYHDKNSDANVCANCGWTTGDPVPIPPLPKTKPPSRIERLVFALLDANYLHPWNAKTYTTESSYVEYMAELIVRQAKMIDGELTKAESHD